MDPAVIDAFTRWLHIASVVIWIGHNWQNVVTTPRYRGVLPGDPPDAVKEVFIAASKREHGIFRYASLVVLATGLVMLWRRDVLVEALTLSGPSATLGAGIWLGVLMVMNLWFVLWPHQKKVLGFVPAPTEERLRCSRITFKSSRVNTVLSVPTMFLMVAGAHGAQILG
ncbi:MAG TPA: urate hydroxylase PuuD [Hyphomicrobium sp.]|nr:urate hydroxylase PuuD [Hyphomicrobium sp.]